MAVPNVATTVEMDRAGFADLQEQLMSGKAQKSEPKDIRDKSEESNKEIKQESKPKSSNNSKRYVFKKGDQSVELDDDYEVEITADKQPRKLTLRELKDRAAGDIAVKNRMHSLAEEKKKVQATLKEFASLAKKDPLGALEFISNQAKEADSEFEYNKYIEQLAEQAEKLGKMDEKERKAWELEKKLEKAEQDLSQKEREAAVVLRKQEILSDFPEIGDQEFSHMVDAVLNNEELFEGMEDEHDVMNRVEDLIIETMTQRDIVTVIKEIDPSYINDTDLIFSLSDQIRQNPDLDEDDVRDILREIIQPQERVPAPSEEKRRDARVLSQKARQSAPIKSLKSQNADPYKILEAQLLERKKTVQKTPLYKR